MTDNLTFNTLRRANLTRLPLFRNSKGEAAHTASDGSDWSLNDWFTALAGEVGEAGNILKKFRRGDMNFFNSSDVKALENELADVLIYLDILAFQIGADLGEITARKFNETSRKVGANVIIVNNSVI